MSLLNYNDLYKRVVVLLTQCLQELIVEYTDAQGKFIPPAPDEAKMLLKNRAKARIAAGALARISVQSSAPGSHLVQPDRPSRRKRYQPSYRFGQTLSSKKQKKQNSQQTQEQTTQTETKKYDYRDDSRLRAPRPWSNR